MALTFGVDTYITIADADQYITDMGLEPFEDDAEAESLLRRATKMIDRRWGAKFLGLKIKVDQPLYWPRYVADASIKYYDYDYVETVDSDGNVRDFKVIPPELGEATVELALLIKSGSSPASQPEAFVTSETIKYGDAELSNSYAESGYRVDEFFSISQILRPLMVSKSKLTMTRGA